MKIIIYGGGSFGTALGNQLSYNTNNNVTILLRDNVVADEINNSHTNNAFFPERKLNITIKATTDLSLISTCDVLIIALPSKAIPKIAEKIKPFLNKKILIVNVSKGLCNDGHTILDFLYSSFVGINKNIVTLKGGSFSSEMFDRSATLLTLGFSKNHQLKTIKNIITGTNIFLDYTTDCKGVELLSAIKNVYAILIGNIDAKFNSANTRTLFLTKAISEMKIILKEMGGKEETIFMSCGIGDFSLTALNDMSRNRTLGLLIGKGFYNAMNEDNTVVLEGIKTLRLINDIITQPLVERLPLLKKMLNFFIYKTDTNFNLDFTKLFDRNYKTVLTYGTFDLLHFGHLEILRRAKQLGDRLIVGLSTDEFNEQKGKKCEFNYEKRKEFLESLEYVDVVIPEKNWEQKSKDVQNHQVDIFVMGDDWKGKFDFLNEYCEVIYFPRTKGISTTDIKTIYNAR